MVEKRVEKKAEEQLGQKLPDLAAGRPLKGAVPEPASTKDLLPEPFMEKAMPERPAEAPPAEARRPAEARPSPPGRSRQARAAAPAVAKAAGPIMPMLLAEAKNVWKKLITRAGTLTRSGFAQAQRGLLAFWTFLRSRALELKNLLSPRKGIWIGSALIVLVVAAAVVIAFVVLRGPAHSSGQKEKSSGQQQPEPEKPKTENQKGIPLSAAQEKTQEGKEQGETGPGKKVSASPTPPVHPPATAPKEGTKPPVPKETAEKENKTVPVSKAGSVEAKAESKPAAEVEKKSAPEVQEEEESAPEGRPKKKKRKKVDLSGLKILD
jgi:hypothetical protein